jgi:hypothetical protein
MVGVTCSAVVCLNYQYLCERIAEGGIRKNMLQGSRVKAEGFQMSRNIHGDRFVMCTLEEEAGGAYVEEWELVMAERFSIQFYLRLKDASSIGEFQLPRPEVTRALVALSTMLSLLKTSLFGALESEFK